MRFCKDCRHVRVECDYTYSEFGFYENYSKRKYRCVAEGRSDPVTGREVQVLCSEARSDTGFCGPDAFYFKEEEPQPEEESKPWWKFW